LKFNILGILVGGAFVTKGIYDPKKIGDLDPSKTGRVGKYAFKN